MSGGSGPWSSTRFFLGGWEMVMGGFGGAEEEGLSVESGDGLVSVVMVEKTESVYMKA